MPSNLEHVEQAKHNLTFLHSFYISGDYNDWSITVSFYSAVHIMEAAIYSSQKLTYRGIPLKKRVFGSEKLAEMAGQQGIPPPENLSWESAKGHWSRKTLVEDNFREISSQYSILYIRSRTARYDKYHFSPEEMDRIIKPALLKIVNWANQKFATGLVVNLPDLVPPSSPPTPAPEPPPIEPAVV